jgi:SNF2 family DNA or RNA helicase
VCFISKFHKNEKAKTLEELRRNKLDVVITTYETCREYIVSKLLVCFECVKSVLPVKSFQEEINQVEWSGVIADEAHKIKVFYYIAFSPYVVKKKYTITLFI